MKIIPKNKKAERQAIGNFAKITVIGGSGFVGTNLCKNLKKNKIDFEIIDIKPSNQFPEHFKVGDVRDLNSLRQAISGDIVINLAAVHRDDIRDKSEYHLTNVKGAENVAAVCSERGIKKIVFTSSVAVYGFASPGTDEAGSINPFNEYGRTKFQAEEVLRAWHASTGNDLIIVRPTVIFGEGNRGNVYNLLSQIASGRFAMVGPGKNKKSMAYIGNVTAFLERCIEADCDFAVVNYVDTPDVDMNALVAHVRKKLNLGSKLGIRLPYWLGLLIGYAGDLFSVASGRKASITSIRVKKFCSTTSFSSSACRLFDFSPPYSLMQGLDLTLDGEFLNPNPNQEVFFTE